MHEQSVRDHRFLFFQRANNMIHSFVLIVSGIIIIIDNRPKGSDRAGGVRPASENPCRQNTNSSSEKYSRRRMVVESLLALTTYNETARVPPRKGKNKTNVALNGFLCSKWTTRSFEQIKNIPQSQ